MNVMLDLSNASARAELSEIVRAGGHRVVDDAALALVYIVDDGLHDFANRIARVRTAQPVIEAIVLVSPGREAELPTQICDFVVRPARAPELLARLARVAQRRVAAGTRYEDLLALAVEATGDVIEISDPAGTIQYVNPAFERVLGYPAEAAIGRNADSLLDPAQHSELYLAKIRETLGRGRIWRGLLVSTHKDGAAVFFDSTLVPVHDVSGAVTHQIAVKRDVTDSRKARAELVNVNESLSQARDAALEASRVKSQFLANMSHELRTPLNAIIGYAEMLSEEAEELAEEGKAAPMVDDLDRIRSAGRHLLSLVNDVLDLSKIEAGHMELYLERFGLRSLVEAVFATLMPLVDARRNAVALRMELAEDEVTADLVKLRQTLVNLISNANKFTNAGRIWVRVRPDRPPEGATTLGPWYAIDISDTGIGMTDEERARLFLAFVQADASTTRRFGGTGLGLTISQRFVEMMGGRIEVQSEPGVGSVFTIRLPRTVESQRNAEASDVARGALTRVLLIDEDRQLAARLEGTLARAGFALEVATHGAEGLERVRSQAPELVILDLVLPGMSGLEVMEAMARDPQTASVPVIVLSAVESVDAEDHARLSRSVARLSKPVDPLELVAVLRHHSRRSAAHVLVVDDDPEMRALLTRTLSVAGHSVVEASDGNAGLARMQERKPDLVVVDLMMPGMDGLAFLETMRADPELNKVLAIVTTAKSLDADERNRLEHLADELLSKNAYAMRELVELVARRLHERLAQRRAMDSTNPNLAVPDPRRG